MPEPERPVTTTAWSGSLIRRLPGVARRSRRWSMRAAKSAALCRPTARAAARSRAAVSISMAMLRPGTTGMRTSGSATLEQRRTSCRRGPRRSASSLQSISSTTRSSLPLVERRERAEERLDVDHAEAADLHVVREQRRGAPAQHGRRDAPHDDSVVGDQAMAARHEVERRLALADAAAAEDQDAEAVHLDQVGVHRRLGREPLFEPRRHLPDEVGACGAPEASTATPLRAGGIARARRGAGVPFVTTKHATPDADDRLDALARDRGIERLEEADLAVAEHLHAVGMELRQVAGEREPGLLHARHGDRRGRARAAGHEPRAPAARPSASSSSPTVTLNSARPRRG